jgi:hypothetical protein
MELQSDEEYIWARGAEEKEQGGGINQAKPIQTIMQNKRKSNQMGGSFFPTYWRL